MEQKHEISDYLHIGQFSEASYDNSSNAEPITPAQEVLNTYITDGVAVVEPSAETTSAYIQAQTVDEDNNYIANETSPEVNQYSDTEDEHPEEKNLELTFSDTEADESNVFFQSFIGVTQLPMGSISLTKYLSSGAFGQVYKGQWGEHPVALKKIDVSHAQKSFPNLHQEQILESLQWEVSRLSTISHPNCVQFYGIYQHKTQTRTYLVMEFCEGGTLEHRLKNADELSWGTRWKWALEMTQGLAYLHENGVLHRDLKAENILLDKQGCAKLADLGVAQVDALLQGKEATIVSTGLQDQRFIAPENLDNPALSTPATDMYALGLVFWQIVTGKAPRHPKNISNDEKAQWKTGKAGYEREAIPSDCLPEFRALILACWQTDPAKRPTAGQLLKQLQDLALCFHPDAELVQAAETLETLIHPKRLEGLSYIAPYLTASQVNEPIESYWGRIESSNTSTHANAPLELQTELQEFLDDPDAASLLLLGEAGLGKTLSTYLLADRLMRAWQTYLNDPHNKTVPDYLPIFIRPTLAHWSYQALKDGFSKALIFYGFTEAQISKTGFLLIIDGYDECRQDDAPQNLAEQLGIPDDVKVKLLVTCRPNTVKYSELKNRFAFRESLAVRYFLPFNITQMLEYLTAQLSWEGEENKIRNNYHSKLKGSLNLRTVLRNPFVLQLFVKSFETISQKDFNCLNRSGIYESAVEHWLMSRSLLLSNSVLENLRGGRKGLIESFEVFASQVAFTAFGDHEIFLKLELLKKFNSSWKNLKAEVAQAGEETYQGYSLFLLAVKKQMLSPNELLKWCVEKEKQKKISPPFLLKQQMGDQVLFYLYGLSEKGKPIITPMESGTISRLKFKKNEVLQVSKTRHPEIYQEINSKRSHVKSAGRRSLLSQEDYLKILQERCVQFESDSPLKARAESLEFSHKSFFEYFAAKRLIRMMQKAPQLALHEGLQLLNSRSLQEEPEVLRFWIEGWESSETRILTEPLFEIVRASRENASLFQAASNAATLLAAVRVPFSGRDLRGVEIPGADLSGAICDHTNFHGANLKGVNFSQSFLGSANLMKANLTGVKFGEYPTLKVEGKVNCIAYSKDGRHLVMGLGGRGDNINCIKLFEDKTGEGEFEETATLHGHTDEVRSVAFSPDESRIASGSGDDTVKVWDSESGKEIATLSGHTGRVMSVAFSPDGSRIVSGSDDYTVKVWESGSGKETATLHGHTNEVRSVAFSPDGRQIASGGDDNTVKVWGSESGKETATLSGHTGRVMSVAFSPDGMQIASGSWDNTVKVWESESGKETATLSGHTNSVECVAFSPDGRQIASGSYDNTVKVWGSESGKEIATLSGHTGFVTSVAFSPDGRQIASGSDDSTVKVWESESGKETATLNGHTSCVWSVAFSPDGRQIASGSDDNTVKVWNSERGKETATLSGHTNSVECVAFSPDGRLIASGSLDETVKVWESESGKETATLSGHTSFVMSIAFSPDGRQIASGSEDQMVKVWESESGKETATLSGHTKAVRSVAFSPDGRQIASGSDDNTVKVWGSESGKETATLSGHTDSVGCVAFSPDGRQIASGSSDHKVKVWNSESGKETATLSGHTDSVGCVAYSPDGRLIASGSYDHKVKVWESESGKETATLSGHTSYVTSVAFSSDGKQIASGSDDRAVFIWERTKKYEKEGEESWRLNCRLTRFYTLYMENAYFKDATLSGVNQRLLHQRGGREENSISFYAEGTKDYKVEVELIPDENPEKVEKTKEKKTRRRFFSLGKTTDKKTISDTPTYRYSANAHALNPQTFYHHSTNTPGIVKKMEKKEINEKKKRRHEEGKSREQLDEKCLMM